MFRKLLAFVGGKEVAPGMGGSFKCHLQKVAFHATHLPCWDAASSHVTPAMRLLVRTHSDMTVMVDLV